MKIKDMLSTLNISTNELYYLVNITELKALS